jgi:hypothetical protein
MWGDERKGAESSQEVINFSQITSVWATRIITNFTDEDLLSFYIAGIGTESLYPVPNSSPIQWWLRAFEHWTKGSNSAWGMSSAYFWWVLWEICKYATLSSNPHVTGSERWSSWFRHYAISRNVACSIPNEVTGFFNWPNPSSCIMALGSIQSLTATSTRDLHGGKGRATLKADVTDNSEPIVYKMWGPRRLKNLWGSTVCYRDSIIL